MNVKNIDLSTDKMSSGTATIDGAPVPAGQALTAAAANDSTARTDAALAGAPGSAAAPAANANPRVPRLSVSFEVQTYYADISTQTGGKACAKAP